MNSVHNSRYLGLSRKEAHLVKLIGRKYESTSTGLTGSVVELRPDRWKNISRKPEEKPVVVLSLSKEPQVESLMWKTAAWRKSGPISLCSLGSKSTVRCLICSETVAGEIPMLLELLTTL